MQEFHIFQIHQITGIAAGKIVFFQLVFILGKSPPQADILRLGVENQRMSGNLHIQNIVDSDTMCFPFGFQKQPVTDMMVEQDIQHSLELHLKGVIQQRFEDIVIGIDLISFNGILRKVGDKHHHNTGILLPDFAGHLHAGHVRQPDIQKKQIVIGCIACQQRGASGKHLCLVHKVQMGKLVSLEKLQHLFTLFCFVFQNCDLQHKSPPFRLFPLYRNLELDTSIPYLLLLGNSSVTLSAFFSITDCPTVFLFSTVFIW